MQRLPHERLSLLLGILVFLFNPEAGVSRAGSILDQKLDPTNDANVFAGLSASLPSQRRAQTFTVGISGMLNEVDVFINQLGATSGNLILQIRSTTAGVPVADPVFLVQETVAASSVPPMTGGFFAFDVSSANLPVTAGEQLAIVLSASGGSSTFNWFGVQGNPYPSGSAFEEDPPNHGWVLEQPVYDLGFETFVTVPEPGSAVIFSLGLLGAAAFRIWLRRS
jgi:hypothetical protein